MQRVENTDWGEPEDEVGPKDPLELEPSERSEASSMTQDPQEPLKSMLLNRIGRLQMHYTILRQTLPEDDYMRKLTFKALSSTWRDCRQLGIMDEARIVMSQTRAKALGQEPQN